MESVDLAGRYCIHELVGEGGMGRVFRAYDTKLHRQVAVKLLRADSFPSGSEALARVLREARLAAALEHPGAVAIYDVGEDSSGPFIVMEFVSGRVLRELIGAGVALAERLRWLIDIARILAAAHRLGLVHRDIKPENVMIRADVSVKLLDFGIALRMRTSDGSERGESSAGGAGTPHYMAPEQIQRRVVDARTDQFAWGVVAYELLAGTLPWRSLADGATTALAVVTERQRPLSSVALAVPARLAQIIDRALEKAPARRFESMDALLSALVSVPEFALVEQAELDARTTLPDEPSPRSPGSDQTRPSETRADRRSSTRSASRGWRRVTALASMLGAIAVTVATVAMVAERASWRASESSRELEPKSDWRPTPEAQAAFDEGMRRFQGAALHAAIRKFETAVEYEPEFAAAHLRLGFIQMFDGPHPVGSEAFHSATRLRRRLDAKDRQLLDALEPAFASEPPALDEAARRLELLARFDSSDTELQLIHAMTLSLDGRYDEAEVAYRALLDGGAPVATAWLDLAYGYGGEQLEHARDALSRCVQMTPDAVDCIWYATKLDASAGRCEAMEAGARAWMELGPDDHGAPLTLLSALVVRNAEPAEIEAARAEAEARMSPNRRMIELSFVRASQSILAGQLDEADRLLAELAKAIRLDPRERVRVGELRVALHEEMDDLAGASAIAADHLQRKGSLLGEGYDGEGDIANDPSPYFDSIRLAAGEIGRDELELRRQRWLASWRERVGVEFDDLLWQRAYAQTTRSGADAHEALAQLAALDVRPRFVSDRLFVVDTGHVYLLAGQPDRAASLLREAVNSCLAMSEPLVFVQAHERLGRALEAIGDQDGACSAYAGVLARWGEAVPGSRTASAARLRWTQLGCDAR
jgi:serine/threonine protein kinase